MSSLNLATMDIPALTVALQAGQITADAFSAEIARRTKPAPAGRKQTIKRNQSGGLFVSDPAFRCYSIAKSKEYQGSFNMDWAVASKLFGANADPALVASIAAFVDSSQAPNAVKTAA